MSGEATLQRVNAADAQPSQETNPPSGEPAPKPGATISRQEVVHGVNTGQKVEFHKGVTHERQHHAPETEKPIKSETITKYETFLNAYVTNLGKLAEQTAPPGTGANNMLEYVLQDPTKRSDKLIMDLLAERVVDKDGRTITQIAATDKVAAFLKSSEGMAIATQKMEQYALWAELGMGVEATINEPRTNTRKPHEGDQTAIIDRITTLPGLSKTVFSNVAVSLGAAGFWATQRGTTHLEFKSDIDMFQSVLNNASLQDKAYIKGVVGIDLDAYQVAGGKVSYKSGYKGHSPDFRAIQSSVANAYSARKEYLTQLGIDEVPTTHLGLNIDRSRNIRLPEEFIFDPRKNPEGIPVRYYMEVMDKYTELAGTATDKYGQLRAMEQAREFVMFRYLERQIALQQTDKEGDVLTKLGEKKNQMATNPESYRSEQREIHTKNKEKAEEASKAAKDKKTELLDSAPAKDRAVIALETEILQQFDIPLGEDLETAISARLDELEQNKNDALDQRLRIQEKIAGELGVMRGQVIAAMKLDSERIGQAVADNAAKAKGGITIQRPNYEQYVTISTQNIEGLSATELARWQKEINDAEAAINALKTKRDEYRIAVNKREETNFIIAGREPNQISQMQNAYAEMTSAGVTADEVRDLSVDQLAEKLSSTLSRDERIKKAIYAKAEHAALQKEVEIPIPDNQRDALNQITTLTSITPDQMFSTSLVELRGILKVARPDIADDAAKQMLLSARLAAGRMLRNRFDARINGEIAYFDGVAKAEKKMIDEMGDFKPQIGELDSTISVLRKKGETYSRVSALVDNPSEVDKLFATGRVESTDTTYSQAERDATAERGYYEWMRMLHSEYTSDPGRDQIFQSLNRSLSPEQLGQIINRELGLRLPADASLTDVFDRINSSRRIKASLTGPMLQQLTARIIGYMKDRALAI